MEFMKGPDFPTGAIVEGKQGGIRTAFEKGRGKVVVRSKTEIIHEKNMNKIIVSEIPYEVNKAELVRKLDEIRFNKSVDGIIEVRDESDRNGLSIVIDLKKDVDVQNTLNYFFKNTDLQKIIIIIWLLSKIKDLYVWGGLKLFLMAIFSIKSK